MAHTEIASLPLEQILQKRTGLRRQLLQREGLSELRIAVLGGSTTNEVVALLELLLLDKGWKLTFYQSEYGRFYEDAVLEPQALAAFRPDLIYIHTSSKNLRFLPTAACSEDEFKQAIEAEMDRFRTIWKSLEQHVGCQVIQNNFDPLPYAPLGNLDAVVPGGGVRYVRELNREMARAAASQSKLVLQDLASLAANIGLAHWHDQERWFSYKIPMTAEGSFAIARSLVSLVLATYGRSRKVLVLDLDNTLWGGVIGDDGVEKIVIGRETPLAEAYTAFQEYCLKQRERGVLLAVASKNNDEIARSGFGHPDSVLRLEHFSAFRANWEPKHENILSIAKELNLGVDSFVFVDDNPAERAIVAAQIPGIAVPDVGTDVAQYAGVLDAGRYFEAVALGKEDLERARLYAENAQRAQLEQTFATYGDYLDSLEMSAEIDLFQPTYMDRIAQLTNKTNQFNLTTRRYTLAELEAATRDGKHIGIYGRLADRFGDNGLISVVLGRREDEALHLDLWLMSCRVLKREMEFAMLDVLVRHAAEQGVQRLVGYYLPTAKNGMVADHYEKLGFTRVSSDEKGATAWSLDVPTYQPKTNHIRILEKVHA